MLLRAKEKGEQGSGSHVGKPGESQVAEKSRTQGHTRGQRIPARQPGTRGHGGEPVSRPPPRLGGLLPPLGAASIGISQVGRGRATGSFCIFYFILTSSKSRSQKAPSGRLTLVPVSRKTSSRVRVRFTVCAASQLNAYSRSHQGGGLAVRADM